MAGSPDRSKQQESSGGPAPEERDPRLAMARQSPERVDQATAVFSVRDVPAAGAESGSATDPDPDPDAERDVPAPGSASDSGADVETSTAGTEPGSGEEPGDARLRAAVAAWVSGPRDGSAGEGASGGSGAADAAADAPGAEGEPEVADGDDDRPEGARAATDTDDVEADSTSEDGGDATEAFAAPTDADAEPTDAPEASDADVERADAPEASGEAADAKPSTGAQASAAGADATASTSDEKAAAADGKAPAAGVKTPATGAKALAAGTKAPAAGVKAPDADAKPSAGDAKPSDAEAKPSDADAKAPAAGAKAPAAGVKAPDADAKPSAGDAKPSDAEAKPSDADAKAPAAGANAPAADADANAKAPAAGAKPPADAAGAKAPASAAGTPADAKPPAPGTGTPAPQVDQATAVFKAVKPPVDQPTQMLKSLGAKPAGAGKAESDAERTSKFVPLKGYDLGAAAKANAAPPEPKPYGGPERTTQQPLPPRPPLDLLAELTNTPPPPETPVRTAVRRVKIWTPIVLLLAVVFGVVQAVRPLPTPTLALTAESTFSFDGDKVSLPWPTEGQGWMDVSGVGTMDHFGEQKPVPIGSVAKAMTAYVVLKDHPLKPGEDGPSIDVDAKAEKEGGYDSEGESTLNTVKAGDKLSQKDALSAIMIPSANNVARLLARWDAGSEEAFVKKMNATAKKLGMTGTTYTDPSGLKETTVSTAQDQVKLGNELVKIQALMDITKLPSWKDPSGKTWQNYNRLVPYNNAVGVKTGSTTKAGGNLLFAATKDAGGETVTVVGAVLGQHRPPIIDTVNAVSKTAMLAAQDAVKASTILKKGDVVGYVDDGLGGHTPVVVDKNVSAVGWAGLTVKLELTDGATAVPHAAKAGTKVGVLKVGDGSGGAVEVPVSLQKNLAEPGLGAKLTRVG